VPKQLRTSKTPGRTQAINVFEITYLDQDVEKKAYLYDLPGYGFAKVSKSMIKSWQELIHNFFLSISDKVLICNIQDARHPYQKSDQDFYAYIDPKSMNIFLIFNKMDKLKKTKRKICFK
jgi:GTP-binding protein